MDNETPIQKAERLLALTDKILNRKSEPELITSTELLKLNTSALKFEYQTPADDNGNYAIYYSIYNKHYMVQMNMYC
tara:strand:- start:64 stop:294 length:231 start_codon:yes stop_codon:yes gene_type:complete